MAEPGTLAHFAANRSSYLTLRQARERIGVVEQRIRKYRAEGMPAYVVLGTTYILEVDLLAMYRAKRKRSNANDAYGKPDLPPFASG